MAWAMPGIRLYADQFFILTNSDLPGQLRSKHRTINSALSSAPPRQTLVQAQLPVKLT